ncbi:hypothetical protein [Parasedimentitalea psychrophila]|uniref:Uncharacterized protein n=1 Tax=Parasedimentitalea psychrophila TaxID=2997337 RepID=A0A9Y2P6P4_9RHOB|nr:hypothetical protein [Parasedimentitalea psychrophila]WIY27644.1 hypothetical protein QPJ95_18100 [Parasedimentitalea psychrophila]
MTSNGYLIAQFFNPRVNIRTEPTLTSIG